MSIPDADGSVSTIPGLGDLELAEHRKTDDGAIDGNEMDPGSLEQSQYRSVAGDYVFEADDILLVSGNDSAIANYSTREVDEGTIGGNFLKRLFKKT